MYEYMYNETDDRKIVVFDYEFDITNTDGSKSFKHGEFFCFAISDGNSTTLLKIEDFDNEVELIKGFFIELEKIGATNVVVHFLGSFLMALEHRAEANNITIKELMDPNNKCQDIEPKFTIIDIRKSHGSNIVMLPLHEYKYELIMPNSFKFIDLITLYAERLGPIKSMRLSDIVETTLNKKLKHASLKDALKMSREDMVKYVVEDIELTYEVVTKLLEHKLR